MSRPFTEVEGRFYWQCEGGCEAVWLEPAQRLAPAQEAAHYRLHENRVDDPAYRQFLSRVSVPLLAVLPASPLQGLDFGCGPGPALAAMLEEAGHCMSVYDPLFANRAAVLERQYDFVTCTEVVEHFHDPAAALRQLRALVRPGGWLAIMTSMLDEAIDFGAWHYRRDPTHVVFYRRASFEWLAKACGWTCHFPAADVVLLEHRPGGR